jgi:hypothetical protein
MDGYDYDLFVSHASEDKNDFVRPLVERLEEEHLTVWYDETELKPGDRLVRSIERGLSRSRFGLLVISPAFLRRNWPRVELDALTNREIASGEGVLLPIWLEVDAKTVMDFSPLLADRVAIIGSRGIDYVASRVREVVRPGRSPLVIAREMLEESGVPTPPPSDAWWLDQIESAAELEGEGSFQEAMLWPRWGFPLPERGETPRSRAERLFQAVLRNSWVREAERRPITQVTPPEVVHEFIGEMPGLRETCLRHPSFLAAYAPQLLVPGFGGEFEPIFDDWLAAVDKDGRRGDTISLHRTNLANQDAALLACTFVQGELNGPPVAFFETADYLFWLLSDQSAWLPAEFRAMLGEGMIAWGTWLERGVAFEREDVAEPLMRAVFEAREQKAPVVMDASAQSALVALAEESVDRLRLPEQPNELAARLRESGAIEAAARKGWS